MQITNLEYNILLELGGVELPTYRAVRNGQERAEAFTALRHKGFIELVCAEGDCWHRLTPAGRKLITEPWFAA